MNESQHEAPDTVDPSRSFDVRHESLLARFGEAADVRTHRYEGGAASSIGPYSMLEVPDGIDPTPARRTIELLAGRWTLPVLMELSRGGRRYQDLDEVLDGVSHKVLTDTLRRAERDGLIVRHVDAGRFDTATLYELTELGQSLNLVLKVLAGWATQRWTDVETARQQWGRRRP